MNLDAVNMFYPPKFDITVNRVIRGERFVHSIPWLLFLLCFVILLRTLAPTFYGVDSAELATGAAILGIVHAPGYPLYLVSAHLFTFLPIGDIGFRVNLFSAFSLAMTAPVLYSLLNRLVGARGIAASATLMFIWSFYVWASGTKAEIYAPQILTLALCGWSLVRMYQDYQAEGRATASNALLTGALFGVAVAMAQSSVLFAPGLVIAFILMRVDWRTCLWAGLVGVVIVLATLLYFPLRGAAHPEFNKIGFYDAQGVFHNYDFHTIQGILQAVSAEQFRHLFFSHGYLPSSHQLIQTVSWFWHNYLGIGVVAGLVGGAYLLRKRPGLFAGWAGLALPYTYFYLCYGALDRDTMFGPSYLAWAVLLAFGLQYLLRKLPAVPRYGLLVTIPLLMLVTNFSRVDLSRDVSVRTHAQAVIEALPPNAVVAGYWPDITPLQYLQYVENRRPDLKIYDLFMFEPDDFRTYVDNLNEDQQTIVLTQSAIVAVPDTSYEVVPIWTYLPGQEQLVEFPVLASFRISKEPTAEVSPMTVAEFRLNLVRDVFLGYVHHTLYRSSKSCRLRFCPTNLEPSSTTFRGKL